jgi:hypothetical protein
LARRARYAWTAGEEIAAHGVSMPRNLSLAGGPANQGQPFPFIDWAAGRRVLLAIGWAHDTQQVLPKLGSQVAGKIGFFVRVMWTALGQRVGSCYRE